MIMIMIIIVIVIVVVVIVVVIVIVIISASAAAVVNQERSAAEMLEMQASREHNESKTCQVQHAHADR